MKKIPLRKCTGCFEMKDKKELIRIVRNDKGEFSVDFTSKNPGRGAYICKNIVCLEKAEKIRGLERSFKTKVSKEIYEELRKEITNG
ncbi:nucleic acid-binding protein [Candidatus Epulonipiscium fishelsonii]|uniref:Nucleic acid-binding protein n=1 Tax=Candidatus Epulonipiscium fishelsonii TaxID=77094 RepID=A0ACC8XFX0_9FIRM|nr:nucleic acid-binding protein [Epulopiscium sp. SCG-B11WGA-EpuloA1]ONI42871.1 nucleic acid-binding protein [Epulopiscium sp. SCG-B05WGA-EpuloA1]